jgi:Fur family peroxide stress response transcriptional regulator
MKTLTKHRKLILENMQGRKDHPTAKMVYDSARLTTDNLSFATVYNSLEYLVNQGLIKKLDLDCNIAHYDAVLEKHSHLVCTSCGHIIDFQSDQCIEKMDFSDIGFKPKELSLIIKGTCKHCNESKP